MAFTYFYTDVMFRQQNLPETLQKQGGFIPGIRPGPRTESYLNGVLSRITLVGALFLGTIAILPFIVGIIADGIFNSGTSALSGYNSLIISSTGLLIVVGVVLDTMKQIEAQLMMRNYEGFYPLGNTHLKRAIDNERAISAPTLFFWACPEQARGRRRGAWLNRWAFRRFQRGISSAIT